MEKVINDNFLVNSRNGIDLNLSIPLIKSLLVWCNKQNYNILFDSDIDGDGKNVLEDRVFNKKNLYFISLDNENNVFGGYVNTTINKKVGWLVDTKSFVFSLIRNGKVKNKKYNIKKDEEGNSFLLSSNHDVFYVFGCGNFNGNDINVPKIGFISKFNCNPISYEYYGEQQPLRDNKVNYTIKRVVVLEMN